MVKNSCRKILQTSEYDDNATDGGDDEGPVNVSDGMLVTGVGLFCYKQTMIHNMTHACLSCC